MIPDGAGSAASSSSRRAAGRWFGRLGPAGTSRTRGAATGDSSRFAPFHSLRYSGKDLPGAQTERRAGYPRSGSSGPVRVLLGSETHRSILLLSLASAPEA